MSSPRAPLFPQALPDRPELTSLRAGRGMAPHGAEFWRLGRFSAPTSSAGHRLARWLLLAASAILLAAPARAVTVPMQVVAPCTNDDAPNDSTPGSPLSDLMSIELEALRCGRSEWHPLGSLDARGRECDTLYFDFSFDSIGTTYDVRAWAKDTSGNRSRRPVYCGIAVPARAFEPGLFGAYYNRMDWTQFCGSRIDGPISFDWGSAGPISCVTPYDYSVEWTGKLRVSAGGIYSLWLDVTGGAALWVNGQSLISRLTDQGAWTQGWTQFLEAGTENEIAIRYVFNWQGSARIRFSWTPPGGTKVVVPLDALEH